MLNSRKWQEPRRPILLAKKEEKNDTPKILLKPKENEKEKKTASPQISIAARPAQTESNHNPINNNASAEHRNQPSKYAATVRDSKDSQPPKEPQIQIAQNPQTIVPPQMNRPIPIISDHYQMPSSIQDYLIETNVDFFVVGCIGPLGAGKSSILSFLCDEDEYDGDIQTINDILNGKSGIFRTRSSGDAVFSNMPSTEGIQAYITKHRTIFLDCSPVLCNPYKKDGILNELDDLKMLIFLLSICNLLIVVVDDAGFNMPLMRLIQMAENMKVDLFEKDLNDFRFSPNILICKNKCQNRDFLAESQQRMCSLYKGFFNGSNLKLTTPYANRQSDYSIVWNDDEPLNIFYFPMIDDKSESFFFYFLIVTGHRGIDNVCTFFFLCRAKRIRSLSRSGNAVG